MLVASGILGCLTFYVGCAEQALLPGWQFRRDLKEEAGAMENQALQQHLSFQGSWQEHSERNETKWEWA